jgi:8-amino-7-oxononanoate synthase
MRADSVAKEELKALNDAGLRRSLMPLSVGTGPLVEIDGQRVVNFCSNDYLSLAGHPAIAEAARRAIDEYGVGAGASRLIAGDTVLHHALELRIAIFERCEAARLFNSGYSANLGILSTLCGPQDVIFSDELNHASLIDGARLSRAHVEVYPHGDVAALSRMLKHGSGARRRLICTDAVFSMDGDLAPLAEIVALAERYDAMVVVDEAHATGVFGPRGAGLCEHLGLAQAVDVRMGTLSKALGTLGAYAATTESVAELLLNRARGLVFSTALPPALCAAASASLDLVANEPSLRSRLWKNVQRFASGLLSLGILARPRSQIFPIMVGDAQAAVKLSAQLMERGVFARAIRPPTVPPGTSRIRFSICAGHTEAQIDLALSVLAELVDQRPGLTLRRPGASRGESQFPPLRSHG